MQYIYYAIVGGLILMTANLAMQPGARFDFLSDPVAWLILGSLGYWIFRDHRPRRRHDPHCPVHGDKGNHLSGP